MVSNGQELWPKIQSRWLSFCCCIQRDLLLEVWKNCVFNCCCLFHSRLKNKQRNYSTHLEELQKEEGFDPSRVLVVDDLGSRLTNAKEHGYLGMKVSPHYGFSLSNKGGFLGTSSGAMDEATNLSFSKKIAIH